MLNNIASFFMAIFMLAGLAYIIIERDFTVITVILWAIALVFMCLSEWLLARDRRLQDLARQKAEAEKDLEWTKLMTNLYGEGAITANEARAAAMDTLRRQNLRGV